MHPERPPSGFNTPAEIGVRLVYLLYLSLCVASLVSGLYAVAIQRLEFGVTALLCAPLAYLCRCWLQEGRRCDVVESLDFPLAQLEEPHRNDQLAHFIELVDAWDRLEAKRGTADFHPWELQSVRHEIQQLIHKTPSLARLFRRPLSERGSTDSAD